jgi:hypothetical protein
MAPEPYFTGVLMILEKALLQLRGKTGKGPLTAEESAQISALADALHNVPASLRDYGKPFDEKRIHEALVHYSDLARERQWTLIPMRFSRPPPTPPKPRLRLVKR